MTGPKSIIRWNLFKNFRYQVLTFLLRSKHFKLENSIIIFSSPRGGSTWLMEILREIPGTLINLEPLHARSGVIPKSLNLGWNPHIPDTNKDKSLRQLFRDIFCFNRFNRWTTKYVAIKDIKNSKFVLSKLVLGNNILPWVINNYGEQFNVKPILLVRHPITTCISQLKTFHKLSFLEMVKEYQDHNEFEIPKIANNQRFFDYKVYLDSLKSPLERQIALWCIENSSLFTKDLLDKIILVHYEHLMQDPLKETNLLLNKMHFEQFSYIYDDFNFRNPSASNFLNHYNKDVNRQLMSFLVDLDKDFLNRIQLIFDDFNFKIYSAYSPHPIAT